MFTHTLAIRYSLFRCCIIVSAAAAGLCYSIDEWRWIAIIAVALAFLCMLLSVASLYQHQRSIRDEMATQSALSWTSLTSLAVVTIAVGGSFYCINGYSGFHGNGFLILILPLVFIVVCGTYLLAGICGFHKAMSDTHEMVLVTFLLSVLVYIALVGMHRGQLIFSGWPDDKSGASWMAVINAHVAGISIALTLLGVTCALVTNKDKVLKTSALHHEMCRIADTHITEEQLESLRRRLPESMDRQNTDTIRCYHSTSLLFGFWRNPFAIHDMGCDTLCHALRTRTSQDELKIRMIGPCSFTLHYLIMSRLFRYMEDASKKRGFRKDWATFLEGFVTRATSDIGGNTEYFLSNQALNQRHSLHWWRQYQFLTWAIVRVYYMSLCKCYSVNATSIPSWLSRCKVDIAEHSHYRDPIELRLLQNGAENPPENGCFGKHEYQVSGTSITQRFITGMASEGCLPDAVHLGDAIDRIDGVFFPEYAFAVFSPSKSQLRSGTRRQMLLCHNVLKTLSFSSHKEPNVTILGIENPRLAKHYREVFHFDWKNYRPLMEWVKAWKANAVYARDRLEEIMEAHSDEDGNSPGDIA